MNLGTELTRAYAKTDIQVKPPATLHQSSQLSKDPDLGSDLVSLVGSPIYHVTLGVLRGLEESFGFVHAAFNCHRQHLI